MVMGERSTDLQHGLDRLLHERLDQFEVPGTIIVELRKEILAFFQRPEKNVHGCAVMTPEASVAADRERETKIFDANAHKPKII